jgi:hypothetical protein
MHSVKSGLVRIVCAAAAAAALAIHPGRASAQSWTARLQLDNDVYNFWQRHTRRPDEEYTNGVRATLESWGAPWWGAWLARGIRDCAGARGPEPCRSTEITLGQDLFTPHLDRAPYLVDDWELERPYFAWLYLNAAARITSERTLQRFGLSLGVTGPPAGGEVAQGIAHRIGFNERATGWETQIGFEPGLVAEYRQAWFAGRVGGTRGLAADLAPEISANVGNVRSRVSAGGSGRLGWNLSHPWHAGAWPHRARMEWWILAGGRAEFVARDMSLDGTLRRPSRHVERVSGVKQYEFGLGARYADVTLAWVAVTRSREYRTGPAHHTFSTMVLSLGSLF